MAAIQQLEAHRKFCRHDMEHSLSVARITMLLCMEHGMTHDPDIIYTAALLHDIGRAAEYTEGRPHHEAGTEIAEDILTACSCPSEQKAAILRLIACHRRMPGEGSLEQLFYIADKRSRSCFACPAQDECNWQPEKRTMEIKE